MKYHKTYIANSAMHHMKYLSRNLATEWCIQCRYKLFWMNIWPFDNTMFFIQVYDQVLYYYIWQIMHIVFILCFEGCTIITRRCLYFRYSKLVKMQQLRLHFHSIFNVLFCLLIKINNRLKNLYKLLKNALICILILFYMLNNNIIIFMDK